MTGETALLTSYKVHIKLYHCSIVRRSWFGHLMMSHAKHEVRLCIGFCFVCFLVFVFVSTKLFQFTFKCYHDTERRPSVPIQTGGC